MARYSAGKAAPGECATEFAKRPGIDRRHLFRGQVGDEQADETGRKVK
jgi:hypothetical protein